MDGPGRYYSFEGENDDEIEERRGEERTVRRRLAYCANDSPAVRSLPLSPFPCSPSLTHVDDVGVTCGWLRY